MNLRIKAKQMLCNHLSEPLEFLGNAPIRLFNYPYSLWKCPTCGKLIGKYYEFDPENVSDGYHTFKQLYYQRTVLFASICNLKKENAWKTRKHIDGSDCPKGYFVAGIDTPNGNFSYHCEDKYWDLFKVKEIERTHYDGHNEEDVTRLLNL